MSASPTTTEVTPQKGFEILCAQLTKRGDQAQKRVMAHIREVTGRSTPLPVYHNDTTISDANKLATYKLCVRAVMEEDYSKLQGQSGLGDKTAEPQPEAAAPTAPRKRSKEKVTVPEYEEPMPIKDVEAPEEDTDDAIANAMRVLSAAASKPKVDEVAVRRISQDVTMAALGTFAKGLETQLNDRIGKVAEHVPADDDIREIFRECINNGEFPKDKVQELIDTALRKAAPTFDLDTHIKPRINELLGSTLKDFIKTGPAAIATPRVVVAPVLASSVPDKNDLDLKTYVITKEWEAMLEDLYERSREKHGENVMLVGPHGCGKTTLPRYFAAKYGLPMFMMDCANIREPRDWFGYKTASGGDVRWERSQFDLCLEAGNHVIVLDELPRCTDQVRNTLFPLLDHRRSTFLQERGDHIRVGKGIVFFATANLGFQYTGSSELDAALSDRFVDRVEVNYLPLEKEAEVLVKRTGIDKTTALKLAEIADTIRKKALGNGATLTRTISTRQLEQAAARHKTLGISGLTYTISNHFSAEGGENSERQQVLLAVQGKFGKV